MTDPLSIAGSAVGVISLGVQVTQSLVNFYNSYKGQSSDLLHITARLDSLLNTFQCLRKTLSDRHFQADEQSLIESIETSIQSCHELIRGLQEECQKFSTTSVKGTAAVFKVAGRRATYPFRQSTLQKLDEDIDEICANLSSALDVLQLNDNKRIHDDITRIRAVLDSVRTSQISSNLRNWLNAPDAYIDHNVACAKKYPGTGMWLIKSDKFSKWLIEENSIIWLNAFAGSGKSVLCSTAIQFTLRHGMSDPNVGVAFFYFTFNDKSKQDESGMLRALLLQLSCQVPSGPTDLAQLHDRYTTGMPPSSVLMDYLRRLIERFNHVYILLDALDESPRNGPREYVLDALEAMRNWGLQSLHLFVTSRDESEIRESLDLSPSQQVTIQNGEMDRDISDFISGRLDTDRRLRKLLPYRERIQETLAARAKGMFRWVDCQFEVLRSCPSSEHHLEYMLSSLPESLDETYERMLCNINYHLVEDARRILTLLCFARRPLTVEELIDGVAVEIHNSTGLNRKRRLQNPNGIRDICGEFVGIDSDMDYTSEGHDEDGTTATVRIAHFSVQEYLESERIRHQKAAIFSLASVVGHADIAQICLIYLLERGLSEPRLDESIFKDYPLARYAAMHWYYHYETTTKPAPGLDDCILRLFQSQDSFVTWIKIHDPDRNRGSPIYHNRSLDGIPSRVYYASLLGLDQTLHELIKNWQSNSDVTEQINAQGGRHGNALQAASVGGHVQVVQTLLEKGADVNNPGGTFGNALQAASSGGHIQVVQMLLDKGADVNAKGGFFGNALQIASYKGHTQVLQVLLHKGAHVNEQGGFSHNALQAASINGHIQVVQMLLDHGANVNTQGGKFGNALHTASFGGHVQVVQMLLNQHADITAEELSSALHEAKAGGHSGVVQLLQKHYAALCQKQLVAKTA